MTVVPEVAERRGDVIVLAMVSSSLSDTLADDIMTAFSETTGGELDLILKK